MARIRVDQNDFGKIADGLLDRLTKAADDTIREVETDARARAPFPWLARSIHRRGRSRGGRYIRRQIYADWRWHFINNGTRHQAARPFIDPAVESARASFLRRVRDALEVRR